MMAAKARTWPDAACSSGQRSRMALSRGRSSSVRVSGRRASQFVTSRTVGGAGGSGALVRAPSNGTVGYQNQPNRVAVRR
jgi:hypothetical protein